MGMCDPYGSSPRRPPVDSDALIEGLPEEWTFCETSRLAMRELPSGLYLRSTSGTLSGQKNAMPNSGKTPPFRVIKTGSLEGPPC